MQLASRRDISGAVENKGGDWEQEFINYLVTWHNIVASYQERI